MTLRRIATRLSSASVSSVGEYILRFLRTMLLSRLLSPHDLGAAVALMAILSSCEMITDIGLDKFVMVGRTSDRAQVVAVARQMSVGRAVILGAAIMLLAPLIAAAFGAGEERGAVAWLGLVPLIASFRNWSVVQVQLDYRYGPEAISNLGGRLAGMAALLGACTLVHDARLILINLAVEAAVSVLLSYVLAPRQRVAVIDPALRREAMRFGLPLMVNGIGLITMKQFDQVMVANLFGLSGLAEYSLSLNLAIIPTSVMQQIGGRIALPFVLKSGPSPERSAQAARIVVLGTMLAAALLAIPIGLVLDRVVPLVYGAHYQVTTGFAALAMLTAFIRFCRGGPNMILLQHSRTGRLTMGNMIAGIGLLIGLALALEFRNYESVLAGLVIGDLLSFILLTHLLRQHMAVAAVWRHGAVITAAVAVAAAVMWLDGDLGWLPRGLALLASLLVIGIDAWFIWKRIVRPYLQPQTQPLVPEPALERHLTPAAELSVGHGF